ncbi:TonB C-terminal domain-containing protein [Methylosinus sp. Sm6]|uniref:TonB C-terminal domain-containing protein n=1 Tax=Methylosinus sp. Sm6 TaxID=2866948 RepID=UPI001C98F633|nr:TonB C-terminal domain-containing protein [Methylosinus sp. Sm6]MBY6239904.1 TonB C-terminal domain-containing protein [Methylosinus sp. Sm6]
MKWPIDPKHQRTRDPSRQSPRRRRGWFERYKAAIAVGGVTLTVGGIVVALTRHDDLPPPRQVRELTVISLPPPPPPPPPPDQKPIEETKFEEQQQEFQEQKPIEEAKADPVKDAKADEPPGPLSLDAKGQGPGDSFGLGGKPGGSAFGGGGGGGGGGGWGWYASIVTSQLRSALEQNKKTRKANMRGKIRLWADQSGRVVRVQLAGSTGDAELDAALRSEVFGNLTLREPPPKGMPMPIIISITEQRPS